MESSTVQDIMIGLVRGGASRHIVAAAVAAIIRTTATLNPKLDGEPCLVIDDTEVDHEVDARLQALAQPIRAQVVAGRPVHSARHLVPADVQVRANGAKHQFCHEKPFSDVSAADVRKAQRGQRCSERDRRLGRPGVMNKKRDHITHEEKAQSFVEDPDYDEGLNYCPSLDDDCDLRPPRWMKNGMVYGRAKHRD
eukprot:TRINITY_DN12563_c0_g1_i1.p1 TRINITY_DN12563_c0_g1~~TRINITY_DN12563_c0_g1_i1.p1  ORF type:complete len:195 (-),score=35.76 TRINITY_DN12563_c0_g1_i1:188-772(-)